MNIVNPDNFIQNTKTVIHAHLREKKFEGAESILDTAIYLLTEDGLGSRTQELIDYFYAYPELITPFYVYPKEKS